MMPGIENEKQYQKKHNWKIARAHGNVNKARQRK
jgi:hypothetical protein